MASVRNLYPASRLTCNRGVGVFGSNLAGHGQDFAEPGLLDAGVPGIHFYVLNKSTATARVLQGVQLG